MTTPPRDLDRMRDVVSAYREHGLCVSTTARSLGWNRATTQDWLKEARAKGMIALEETHEANRPTAQDFLAAADQRRAAFLGKKKKGDWRKPVLINLPPGPFLLTVLGDPHLDASGTNPDTFHRAMAGLDPEAGVYGVCVGDFFNNWTRALAHLHRPELPPDTAWTVFDYLMHEHGEGLIAACSGNHDDWSHGPADPIDMVMKRHGVVYRQGAVRVALRCGEAAPILVAIRHKWQGRSMYSPAHGIRRAAEKGWADDIMIGGHIHMDEPRIYVDPDGRISTICQVSAFKEFDDYVDTHGFLPHRISPVWHLVVQPERPPTDPDKVSVFFDYDMARKVLDAVRK